ncbi:hypothetical protein ACFV2X_49985 [Streptomyces sp. NPDC059679]|uniref:hypothetical protein n=1 Tax=Streptomyces sp. NPDC059679 TaxID=3346903 RepID=UPI0036A91FC6
MSTKTGTNDKLAALQSGLANRNGGTGGLQLAAAAAGSPQNRATMVLGSASQRLSQLSPAEQLAECARVIREAEERREETLREARERATARFMDTAGPYLMWVRDHWEDLQELVDGLTFRQWAKKALGYESSHMYLIMDSVEVRAGLGIAGTTDYKVQGIPLNTGHVRALIPAMRSAGVDVAPKMWTQTLERDGKVTEDGLRKTWQTMASEASEDSNKKFEAADVAFERRRVNSALDATVKELDGIVDRLAALIEAGIAPDDAAAAEKAVARIKAAGRWLSGKKVTVPEDVVIEAEVVED